MVAETIFKQDYEKHLHHLKLKGLQPKTIDAYSRSIRYIGKYFDYEIRDLSEQQLADYFIDRLGTHSWSAVKLDLYGLKFFYRHVLKQAWQHVDLIKPPRTKRLPDIVTVEEAAKLFNATHKLSYRVLYFTLYSMGLRLGEGLRLEVSDIDAVPQGSLSGSVTPHLLRHRVHHIRDAKGNKDRFVPLPDVTLKLLRRFWLVHRNPVWLFPNRKVGLKGSFSATSPLEEGRDGTSREAALGYRGGVQVTMRKVVEACGIKKRLRRIVCATVMQLT